MPDPEAPRTPTPRGTGLGCLIVEAAGTNEYEKARGKLPFQPMAAHSKREQERKITDALLGAGRGGRWEQAGSRPPLRDHSPRLPTVPNPHSVALHILQPHPNHTISPPANQLAERCGAGGGGGGRVHRPEVARTASAVLGTVVRAIYGACPKIH